MGTLLRSPARLIAACLIVAIVLLQWLASTPVLADLSGVITGQERLKAVRKQINNINTQQLQELLKKEPTTLIVDVRTPTEVHLLGGMIRAPRSTNIPMGWLEFRIWDWARDKNQKIVVYCGINERSPFAAETLMRMGYTNVLNYADGFFAWKKAGLPVKAPDKDLQSVLYDRPQKVIDGVWSAIGATAPGTYENSGHNNNLSFIITDEGVVVMNAGGNYLLAMALHEEIKARTDKPVKYVVLENAQGHAMLGANYWQEQGAKIIAHRDAAEIMKRHGQRIYERARRRLRDKMIGTKLTVPDIIIDDKMVLDMGGKRMEILYLGPAHSPGDLMLWMPDESLIITGDMAFHERLLPVFRDTDTAKWLETWEKFAALKPKYIIPGHGGPTTLEEVTKYTKDYLVYMRQQVQKILDEGGDLQDAYKIDQSAYAHLDTFKELARQNAERIFQMMEEQEME